MKPAAAVEPGGVDTVERRPVGYRNGENGDCEDDAPNRKPKVALLKENYCNTFLTTVMK